MYCNFWCNACHYCVHLPKYIYCNFVLRLQSISCFPTINNAISTMYLYYKLLVDRHVWTYLCLDMRSDMYHSRLLYTIDCCSSATLWDCSKMVFFLTPYAKTHSGIFYSIVQSPKHIPLTMFIITSTHLSIHLVLFMFGISKVTNLFFNASKSDYI